MFQERPGGLTVEHVETLRGTHVEGTNAVAFVFKPNWWFHNYSASFDTRPGV